MGTSAIAISLPFSCILGLLASMTASTMGMYLSFWKNIFNVLPPFIRNVFGYGLNLCAVMRRSVWIYASVQFALVVLFAHVFYSVVSTLQRISSLTFLYDIVKIPCLGLKQVELQPVLSVLLSTFAGFGVCICGSSVMVEFVRWKRRWRARSLDQQQLNHAQTPTTSQHHSNAA